MKILIAGSRGITNYKKLWNEWFGLPFDWTIPATAIISGCAAGVDSLGMRLAEDLGLNCIQMPANWKTFGRSAGFIRNTEMCKLCDAALILWDGKSNGTSHMIELLKEANKPHVVVILNKDTVD